MYPKFQVSNGTRQPKGPKVSSTINEIHKTRILDAYFTMDGIEFENYFREYKSALLPSVEFATTHPEYVKVETNQKPTESIIVESFNMANRFSILQTKARPRKVYSTNESTWQAKTRF